MGRAPCCDKANVKKGPWSPEEDAKLKEYIEKHGTGGNWIALPQKAGLKRCGKSCRLRWLNYLRPNIKHGEFSDDEDRIICSLFASIGSRWSIIAAQLPGRTDNDIKNYWNTKLKKKLMGMVSPISERKPPQAESASFSSLLQSSAISYNNNNSYYSTPSAAARSFSAGLEPNSSSFSNSLLRTSSGLLRTSCNSCITAATTNLILHTQESRLLYPMQRNYQAAAASCCSSDGSCCNQISSHSKELEYDFDGCRNNNSNSCAQMDLQNISWVHEENQNNNFMISNVNGNNWCEQKPSGSLEETPLDYVLEEIKQLISSSTSSSNNINLFDENNTEEKVMFADSVKSPRFQRYGFEDSD